MASLSVEVQPGMVDTEQSYLVVSKSNRSIIKGLPGLIVFDYY